MKKSLRMPCMTIAQNAGVDASEVVNKVLAASGDQGYDAMNNEYVNMIEKGIIDPTKVYSASCKSISVISKTSTF